MQRQSEDYDYDGPTQDPISAQLGLVADSNRCKKYSAVFSEKMPQDPLKQTRPSFGKALVSFKSPFSSIVSIRENIVDEFTCDGRSYGYYADVANDCQVPTPGSSKDICTKSKVQFASER